MGQSLPRPAIADRSPRPPLAIPEFSWSPVAGATSYRIQFAQNQTFTNPIEYNTPYNIFTPLAASQFNDGTWYWHVRVDAPVAGQFSNPFSFQKTWATSDNAPVLSLPSDAARRLISLTRQPSPGSRCSEQLITSSRFRLIQTFGAIAYSQYTLATTVQPPNKLTNGQYYWRVTPIDPANREGTKSDDFNPPRSFQRQLPAHTRLIRTPRQRHAHIYTHIPLEGRARRSILPASSIPPSPTFNSGVTNIDTTNNTTYTPYSPLPNDVNYYWRVRAHSGYSISNWSAIRSFRKQWYIQPQLLTPINNYQATRFPLYNWTPVPGANYYRIEIGCANTFPPNDTLRHYGLHRKHLLHAGILLRRRMVFATGGSRPTTSTETPANPVMCPLIAASQDFIGPAQIYPFYYYRPDQFFGPSGQISATINPHEDRTVALPVFMWQRVTTPFPTGGTLTNAYRIQVSDDPLFITTDWVTDTQESGRGAHQAEQFCARRTASTTTGAYARWM